jgi:hypothetical protein
MDTRAVVLVEGTSDLHALAALARRQGRDLASEGVEIVRMGGAQGIGACLERYGPHGLDLRLAGLCDAGEERYVRRALERAGLGTGLTRSGMEALGFFVCDADLEDELTRSLGPQAVEQVIAAEGETSAFRTFQKQPEKRGLALEEQLRAFMWNRKIRYATLLVEALDLSRVPRPLDRLLAAV